MKHFRRITARTVLVPLALLVLAFGSSLPASAAPLPDYAYAASTHSFFFLPESLNW